jgi:hypothetical protein
MGAFAYLKFKAGKWVEVDSLPEWVQNAHDGYYEGFRDKHGHRPYDVEKVYNGDSLQYKIYYKTIAQGKINPEYYVKIK